MSNNNKQSKSRLALPTGILNSARASIVSILFLTGCASQHYEPEPIEPQALVEQSVTLDHADPAFRTFLENNHYPAEQWPLPQFDLAALTLAAVYFNPAMQVAESRIDSARAGETIAGQRPNPTLNFPDEPRDTLDFFGLFADFLFERSAKREARQEQARAQRQAAEIALAQQGWFLYSELHAALVEFYAAEQVNTLLARQRDLLKESLQLLEQRLAAGQASEFELSSTRLELQQTELLLSNQRYLSNDAFHRLVAATGLQVDKFKPGDIVFTDLEPHLRPEPASLETLQTRLLYSRYDVRKALAEYNAFEARLKLEIEAQYPDVILSPGFLFEEGQALWILGASWVLPIFHNNDGQIQQALAERKTKQYEFLQLQTSLVNELERKKQNYMDRLAAYEDSQALLSALQKRGEQIEKQYTLGYSDRLAVLRSRLEIEKARQAMLDIELDVMRAAVKLEKVTQSPGNSTIKRLDFMQPTQLVETKQ